MVTATAAPPRRTVRDSERYLFDCHGYVVIPDALDASTVATLLELVRARCAELTREQADRTSFSDSQILASNKAYIDLIDWPSIAPYLEEWLGSGYRLDHEYFLLFKPRCGKGGAFHIHGGGTPFRPGQLYTCHNGIIHSGETGGQLRPHRRRGGRRRARRGCPAATRPTSRSPGRPARGRTPTRW